ncbi:hypothetical protein GSI_06441 [Ganoderma sinense ZZ0214-1]|uniref:Transporter n=1 Tax=Ganoderma sinense ZZ0214-1 TaxID=1077348 RepID=A0A2G8SDD8_9APHY|nr:hypothetical protein GSI_06441 [Ganoderma sinense ZZ0214-1]
MFARNSKVALTFLCLVVALGLATVSEANSLVHSPRDHASLNRMIKKRIPEDSIFPIIPVVGAEGTSASAGTDKASATASNTPSTPSDSATAPILSLTIPSVSATSTSGAASATSTSSSSATSDTSSSSASSALTSTSSSSTVSTTSTSSSSTTTEAATPTQATPTDTQPSSTHTSTVLVTASDSSQPSATAGASTSSASSNNNTKITHTTLTVIIVIAASIGFLVLAWTLFRKWKLRPSSNFDDRMQPIDWQPTGPEESGLPSHRRANSAASHGSFHSSGHGHAGLDALPEHDFTAGASTLAPVGGYADLHRGPSPQPSMAQLHRGPSGTRADYAAYDYNSGMRY